MSSKVVDGGFVVFTSAEENAPPRRPSAFWPAVALISFAGSGICFFAVLLFSAAIELALIHVSKFGSYVGISILLLAFVCAFAGAHALDKDREGRVKKQ